MTADAATGSDDPAVRAEAVAFGSYLTGASPSEAEIRRYVAAVHSGRFPVEGRDLRTLAFVARHPRILGLVDGGLGLRRPRSGVRVRILVMAAILEASPTHVDDFLPQRRSPLYLFAMAVVAARAAIRGAVGAILVTWI